MIEEPDRDELQVEITNSTEPRKNHVYGLNDEVAKAICGAREESVSVFEGARWSRSVEGNEHRVECGNCRRMLNLGKK